jgi:hypothetical protein
MRELEYPFDQRKLLDDVRISQCTCRRTLTGTCKRPICRYVRGYHSSDEGGGNVEARSSCLVTSFEATDDLTLYRMMMDLFTPAMISECE